MEAIALHVQPTYCTLRYCSCTPLHYTFSQPIVQSDIVHARHCTTHFSQPVVQSDIVHARHCTTRLANLLYSPLMRATALPVANLLYSPLMRATARLASLLYNPLSFLSATALHLQWTSLTRRYWPLYNNKMHAGALYTSRHYFLQPGIFYTRRTH